MRRLAYRCLAIGSTGTARMRRVAESVRRFLVHLAAKTSLVLSCVVLGVVLPWCWGWDCIDVGVSEKMGWCYVRDLRKEASSRLNC